MSFSGTGIVAAVLSGCQVFLKVEFKIAARMLMIESKGGVGRG